METKTKVRKPRVAQDQASNNVFKPIRLALCTRTGRVVDMNDVRNANG
jgi:hypothetical protein